MHACAVPQAVHQLTDMVTVPPISDRPRGTVTFLFTDIEGSTLLWEGGRSAMSEALERHDKILQKAISDSGGVIFSTGGDGLAAAFQRAPDALRAALDAQARLQSQTWDPPLSVRMAIHTGDVEERAGDFFGPPLNRCARLMASAHGGQVLCSSITASLASDQLPEGTSLRDLGSHRLRDLSQPEDVFQVLHSNLRSDFPPLRSLDSHRGNLPVQPTVFIGRDVELTEITEALDEATIVTLCGVGGGRKDATGSPSRRISVAAL
jgi:class 3 adenylate cyclase